jgi:hypothetical protein
VRDQEGREKESIKEEKIRDTQYQAGETGAA